MIVTIIDREPEFIKLCAMTFCEFASSAVRVETMIGTIDCIPETRNEIIIYVYQCTTEKVGLRSNSPDGRGGTEVFDKIFPGFDIENNIYCADSDNTIDYIPIGSSMILGTDNPGKYIALCPIVDIGNHVYSRRSDGCGDTGHDRDSVESDCGTRIKIKSASFQEIEDMWDNWKLEPPPDPDPGPDDPDATMDLVSGQVSGGEEGSRAPPGAANANANANVRIKNASNIYEAFLAALCLAKRFTESINEFNIRVVCPRLGGGRCKVRAAEAVKQMRHAYDDFVSRIALDLPCHETITTVSSDDVHPIWYFSRPPNNNMLESKNMYRANKINTYVSRMVAHSAISHNPGNDILDMETANVLPKYALHFKHTDICNTLMSYVNIRYNPGSCVLRAISNAVLWQSPEFTLETCMSTLNAFAALGYNPGDAVIKAITDMLQKKREHLSARDVTNIWCSFATLAHSPGTKFVRTMVSRVRTFASVFEPEEARKILCAASLLGKDLGGENVRRLTELCTNQ